MGRSQKSGKHGQSLSRLAESTKIFQLQKPSKIRSSRNPFITLPFMQMFIAVGQQLGVGQLSLVRKFVDQLGPAICNVLCGPAICNYTASKKYVRTRICPPWLVSCQLSTHKCIPGYRCLVNIYCWLLTLDLPGSGTAFWMLTGCWVSERQIIMLTTSGEAQGGQILTRTHAYILIIVIV